MARLGRIFLLLIIFVALAAPITSRAADERTLTVLHTGSTYNRIQEFKGFKQPTQGGAARRATMAKQIRANHPNTILVSAGQDVMGTPMFAQYGGVASGEIMSRLGYNAALVGQIDISAGGNTDGFKAYRSVATFPLVNANLDLSNLPDIQVPPHTVLTVNGLKVGVFGLVNERGTTLTALGASSGMIDTDVAIKTSLDYFKEQGVNVVVLLSTMTVDRNREVAEQYNGQDGIDVIVGNAYSTILGDAKDLPAWEKPIGSYPLVYNEKSAPTLVVYAGQYGSYLGELNVTFDDAGILKTWNGGVHFLDEKVTPDPEMQAYVDQLAKGIVMDQIVVGETEEELFGPFQEFPWQEIPLANLQADVYLEYGKAYGATIGLVNTGSTWGGIPKGRITLANLYKANPFFNWLIVTDITGEQLWAALENGVSKYGGEPQVSAGRFLAVAGMTYTYDVTKEVGSRILEVTVGDKPLDLKATYSVAINGFMADGGDDFVSFKQGKNTFNTGIPVLDALQQYLQAHSPLPAVKMGRSIEVKSK